MSHIVHTWELGGGSGHISGFIPIANILQKMGHQVSFFVKDAEVISHRLAQFQFPYYQSPIFLSAKKQHQDSFSFSDILNNCGFHNHLPLTIRVKMWINAFESISPDIVVLDYSPTALLAAHIMKLPRVLLGTGFSTPPELSPCPSFRSKIKVPQEHLLRSHENVVKAINQVLSDFGCEAMDSISALYQAADANILCTFKELDHYAVRTGATYWGPRLNLADGHIPNWLATINKKIFIYVHSYYQNLPQLLSALGKLDHSCIVYCPGISQLLIKQYRNGNVDFVDRPVQLNHVINHCDLVVCNAGLGTVSGVLLGGLPILALPIHAEQMIIADNIVKLGAGISSLPEKKNTNFKKLINTLLAENSYSNAAKRFAEKHIDFDVTENQKNIAATIVEHCRGI